MSALVVNGFPHNNNTGFQIGLIIAWQRNNNGSATDVILTGTYTGTPPTTVEAQLNAGAFAALTSETISGGVWSGTLAAIAAGEYTLNLRNSNDHTVTATATLSVGDFYLILGDSIAYGDFISGFLAAATTPIARYVHNASYWLDSGGADGVSAAGWWPILNGLLAQDQGVPIGYINGSVEGTHYYAWHPAGSTYVASAVAAVVGTFLNRVRFVCWHLGANDVGNTFVPQTRADILSQLAMDVVAINAGLPGSAPIHLFAVVGQCPSSQNDLRSDEDQVRLGTLDGVRGAFASVGPVLIDETYPNNGPHPANANAQEIADRWWMSLSAQVYGTTVGRGPRVVGVWSPTSTTFSVRFDRPLGNALTTAVGGFRVTDGGTPLTISSAVVDSTVSVLITTSTSPVGVVAVSFASDNDAAGATVPTSAGITTPDSRTVYLPAEPAIQLPITSPPVRLPFAF